MSLGLGVPLELGRGSGMTCWRRLGDWQHQDVLQRLLTHFVQELKQDGTLADDRLIVDSSLVPAKKGAQIPDPTRVIGEDQAPRYI